MPSCSESDVGKYKDLLIPRAHSYLLLQKNIGLQWGIGLRGRWESIVDTNIDILDLQIRDGGCQKHMHIT